MHKARHSASPFAISLGLVVSSIALSTAITPLAVVAQADAAQSEAGGDARERTSESPALGEVPAPLTQVGNSITETFTAGVESHQGIKAPQFTDVLQGPYAATAEFGSDYEVLVPRDASATPIRIDTTSGYFTSRLLGLDAGPELDGPTVTYGEMDRASFVELEVTRTSLKENIWLSRRPTAPLQFVYEFQVSSGLTVLQLPSGDIQFLNVQGFPEAVIPAGVMFDSASPEAAQSTAVPFEIVDSTTSSFRLRVAPNHEWLSDPRRVYPVRVDPTVTFASPSDCWIRDSTPTQSACAGTSQFIKAGRQDATRRYRSLLKFKLTLPDEAVIDDASLSLYLDPSQPYNASVEANYALFRLSRPFSGPTTWNNADAAQAWTTPGGDFAPTAYGTTPLVGNVEGWKRFDGLATLVQSWVNYDYLNHGLLLQQYPNNVNTVLSFASSSQNGREPRLSVTYHLPSDYDASLEADEPVNTSLGVDSVLLEDLNAIAAQEGISSQEAVRKYGWQGTLSTDLAELADRFPSYADVTTNLTAPSPSVTIRFKGSVPTGALAVIGNLPSFIVKSAVGGQPYSHAEVEAAMQQVHAEFASTSSESATSSIHFDDEQRRIIVTTSQPPTEAAATTQTRLQTAANSASRSISGTADNGPPVSVVVDPGLSATELSTVLGGGDLDDAATGQATCTSGFNVYSVTGLHDRLVHGTITADHCASNLTWYQGQGYTLGRRQVYYESNLSISASKGDMRYFRSASSGAEHFKPKVFFNSSARTRVVTNYTYPSRDLPICAYGDTSNGYVSFATAERTCTKIARLHVTYLSYANTAKRYAMVWETKKSIAKPGDSGGPVMTGPYAVGLISAAGCKGNDPNGNGICESEEEVTTYITSIRPVLQSRASGGLGMNILRRVQ